VQIAGALIGRIASKTEHSETVTLTNIGILASVRGATGVGGLFGRLSADKLTLNVSDCYVAGRITATSGTGNKITAFGHVDIGTAIFSNCYYLEGCASGMTVSAPAGSESRTETDFTSGKVAYELRKKTTGTGNAWGQNLPGETRPHPGSAPAYWDDDRKRYFNLDRIRSVSIALGTDLTARFYCYMSEAHDNDGAEMRFLWHGEETVVKREIVKDEEPPAIGEPPVLLRMFSFRGICSQCMNDPLTAVLQYNDGETVSELDRREDFRVVDYAVLRLNATDSGTEKQILADMIAYGSASQVYAQYRTDALAKNDSAYLDALRDSGASAREDNPPAKEKTLTGSATAAGSCWKSAALYFDYNQRFALRFLAAASDCSSGALTVKETRGSGERIYTASDFAAEDGGIYRLLTDPFSVKDFGTDATYELRFGDNTVQTLTYGVNVWCYTVSNGGDAYPQAAKDLAAATYRYGASAAAYAADHS
ncbi:MAG: hypothetical protein ILO68_01750, partial [Clostridia bacterium]|nr:hypothetical protein [Clostridia bacterium]